MGDEVNFLCADKHKRFYKLIVSLWVCAPRHAQCTQNNKFAISFQYLKVHQIDTMILCVYGQAYPNHPK